MADRKRQLEAIDRLLTIMDDLREQCPWDRKQTFESLRHLTIEETYELSESLLKGSPEDIKSELGDLLLHIIFYAKIGSEQSSFDIADVANRICDKLIQRHPHVYGDVEVADEKEVRQNWEQLKLKHDRKGVLDGVPDSLPPLVKAYRMQEKAAGVGFDWDQTEGVIQKIDEELQEFYDEVDRNDKASAEAEFGDLLFSLVNYARFIGINPDDALSRTNQKFRSRFVDMEKKISDRQIKMNQLKLDDWEKLWQEVKSEK
ncbi:MAG: nucleoside triphosphate pyrophosphohydrolase [Flavobacteriaceae bacterium]|nr:nucleoside triphosphate pyrophosphohydrolase [Flavobacteriaceae bacterium]